MTKKCNDVVPLLGPLNDGALEADDREWVEEHLRGCSSCSDRRALLAAQGAALREVLGARAAAVSFDGFADRVMARVEKEGRGGLAERAPVWLREMWGAHHTAFTAAASLAAAACVALGVLLAPQQQPDEAPLLAEANPPQIEEVDFGTHDGAVLELPGDTTVIWMSDDAKAVPQ